MKRSSPQKQRQDYRKNGKYAKVNPCYACGKSAGVNYSSHTLTDCNGWGDQALCLCKKCYNSTEEMTEVSEFLEYKKQFGDASKKAWLKIRDEES